MPGLWQRKDGGLQPGRVTGVPRRLPQRLALSERGPGLVLNILVSKTELGRFILSETQSAGHWDRLCDRHS